MITYIQAFEYSGVSLRLKSFEIAKLKQLAAQENFGKKYDFITQCVVSGKSTEEIEKMANLFK
ncbi:hypothetical protein VP01_1645g2 [Puccinia sorghi]|uniref:Uncharacterized protein n=1 Tax=Puccinia sorghi TaxID=27349 RepID=A0A0L6VGQ5_9BASI|nr:hypothetical protein VP01_1645g2 [Puccinia sorghi]